jgi:PAS domain S-box-containing protein
MIDLLVIFDGKGIVRGVNCAVTQLLGYSPKQMIGQRLAGILDSNQEEAALLEKLRRFGEIRDTELSFISDQGERVPLLFNGSSLKDERGRTIAFLLVARDMREIRKMIADLREARSNLETKVMARTAELVEAQKKLVESEKYAAIGQLAAGAAHELNNPLTAVMGHSEMILLTLERDHQWYESVKGIVEAAERCRNIVSALLSYSRRKARSFRRFNLNGVVEKSLIACQGVAGMDRIRLRKEYWPEPVFVEGDEDGICQSFSEIIVNALEAMPASGDLVIRTRRDNGSAMVEFMDTGGGIVEDQIYRIFDPFFSTKENRIGLGLSKCQNIARDHGGVVEVCSTPDEGSTFRISLPCKNSGGGL